MSETAFDIAGMLALVSPMTVRGAQVWVDTRGPASALALLYIHGGPGQGAYDFMSYQGDRLSRKLRLIGLDQRGVLRSDPLAPDGGLSEHDLIDDFEALRDMLGVQRWAILGHSFGGRLALRYAAGHPDTVSSVVFENPVWDLSLSSEHMLKTALPLLQDAGKHEAADQVRSMLTLNMPLTSEAWRARMNMINELGPRKMELYVRQPDVLRRLGELFPADALGEELRYRGIAYAEALMRTPSFSIPLLPLLAKLRQPALLIKGASDLVTSPAEVEHFRNDTRHGELQVFENSGHFAQFEEPEHYALAVEAFVTAYP